jgi:hypothetical protein
MTFPPQKVSPHVGRVLLLTDPDPSHEVEEQSSKVQI